MPNLKDIKTRISSVKKTKQITSAMKLVAGAKLRRATERAMSARPYRAQLSDVLVRVAGNVGESTSEPLLQSRPDVTKILVAVLTTDRGLCGGFNSNLLRKTSPWLKDRAASEVEVDISVFGRKGADFLKSRGFDIGERTLDYGKEEKMDLVRPLTAKMVAGFLDGTYDEVWIVFNEFVNALVQEPTFTRVLPIAIDEDAAAEASSNEAQAQIEYRYEPSADGVLKALLPLYLRTLILTSFLETEAGEHAARMTAMDNATRNASDLIDRLTLEFNRARQAAITTEITEIVSGAEALK
jgi:F-type H+-transporting ATPase subunit gamma